MTDKQIISKTIVKARKLIPEIELLKGHPVIAKDLSGHKYKAIEFYIQYNNRFIKMYQDKELLKIHPQPVDACLQRISIGFESLKILE